MRSAPWMLVLLSCALPAAAAGPDDAKLAATLASLQRTQRVVATFEQTKTLAAFDAPQVARGTLYVARPDKLRWAYEAPYRMVLVQRGDRVSMSYPDLKRKQAFDLARDPQTKAVFETILFFQNADPAAVAKRFDARVDPAGQLVLVPRGKAATLLAQVEVWVDVERGVLTRLKLREPDGDVTDLAFGDIQVDAPIDDALLTP